jgi:hypothetical protein
MKKNMRYRACPAGVTAVLLCLTLTPTSFIDSSAAAQTQGTQVALSAADEQVVAAFERRVKEYSKLRERLEGKMPKLSKDATPEQIDAHKTAFQARVRAARAGAKPGQMFRPDIADFIRATIKDEFKGRDRAELRETVFEAETRGVPVRVNHPYPAARELVQMPPTLLLRLPQLPKQVRYRFVGRNLLLVDRENALILDYMTNALP